MRFDLLSRLRSRGTALLAATLAGLAMTGGALADTYEVKLPPELSSSPKMCDYAPCKDVMPGATSFSERKGQPPFVEAYKDEAGQKKLLGYVMLSTDITDTPAYSGKPVVTLIGMDTAGRFTGVKILKHSEPILLLGIPESALIKFNNQYLGKFVGDNIEIGKSRSEENLIGLDAITGATVTVIAQNQVMMTSGSAVAKQVGILKPVIRPQAKFPATTAAPSWAQLVEDGSVQRLVVKAEEVGLKSDGRPYMDLWFGYLNQPTIGQAVLGKDGYAGLMARLKEGEHAIFIIKTAGMDSFKGSGFVRGGIYDRVQVRQDSDSFTFRDLDYVNLWGVSAAGAPAFDESAIFIIRGKSFSGAYPWKLVFLGNKIDKETSTKTFANFDKEYWLAARYLEGGRPVVIKPDPTWLKVWKERAFEIGGFVVFLLAIAAAYASRDTLVRRSSRHNKWPVNAFKYTGWVVSIGFVGFYAMAQPSITQMLTWFHSLLFQWKWELFLSDPLIFVFWIFIIVTTFLWGRGSFCGWLCPFGSLSELLYKLGQAVGLKRFQFHLPQAHARQAEVGEVRGVLRAARGVLVSAWAWPKSSPKSNPSRPPSWSASPTAAGPTACSPPACSAWRSSRSGRSASTCARWAPRWPCPPPSAGSASGASTNAPAARPAQRAAARWPSTTKGNIDQRECMLCLDCMVFYTTTTPARRWPTNASAATRPASRSRRSTARATSSRSTRFRPIQRRVPQHDHRRQRTNCASPPTATRGASAG
jgi:NosR/NirI family nitrous oxide reductase transcriptional regulator